MTQGFSGELEPVGHKSANHLSITQADDANEADRISSLEDKYLWHIHGKRYDFRTFVHQHPAGPTMILMGQGRDCTELFESYHAMTDLPSKFLKAYEVRPDESPLEEPSFHWQTTPFFDALKTRVRAHFVATGRSHKASTGMCLRILIGLLSLFVITFYWLCGHWWTIIALPCVYWITCSLLLHSGGHSAISKIWRVNYYLSYFGCFHSSLTTWIHQHNIGHHTQTNIDGKDPDLQHFQHLEPDKAPGYRLTQQQPWVPKYTNFLVAIFFQMNFTALGPALMCEPLYYSQDAYLGTVPFMYLSPSTRKRHWVGRGLVFAWMFILPYALHGLIKGLFFSFIPYNLLGCLYFAFSQVSHLSDTCFDRAPPCPDSPCGRPEWAAHQVVSACDYSTRSWLWGFLSIGLNNQIVHHLFPAVDPSHYPDLAPIVEATCADFGVKYTAHGSWAEAWSRHLQWVRVLNEVDPSTIIPAAEIPRTMPVKRCVARPEPPGAEGLFVDHD